MLIEIVGAESRLAPPAIGVWVVARLGPDTGQASIERILSRVDHVLSNGQVRIERSRLLQTFQLFGADYIHRILRRVIVVGVQHLESLRVQPHLLRIGVSDHG